MFKIILLTTQKTRQYFKGMLPWSKCLVYFFITKRRLYGAKNINIVSRQPPQPLLLGC